MKHLAGKKWETGTCERSQECVAGNGGGSEHEVCVNKVIEGLKEDGHEAEAGEDAAEGGDNPGDVAGESSPTPMIVSFDLIFCAVGKGEKGESCCLPSEPEDTNSKGNASGHHAWQSPLGHRNAIVPRQFAIIPGLLQDNSGTSQELSGNHTKEGETALSRVEAVNANKDERIGGKEEIQDAINKTHVDGEGENDGFGKEETHGTRQVLLNELLEVDFDFFLLGVDAPVLGASSQIGSLVDQDDGRVGLF